MVEQKFTFIFLGSPVHGNAAAAISILFAGAAAERQAMESEIKIGSPAKEDGR